MQKHSDEYKAAWDGKGPDGGVLATWDDYITAVSAESAYVSDLELKATARLYDVKVVLVPEMAHFPPVVFHSGQKSPKRCLIMWYSGCHLDLLLVADGKKLPTDIAEVTAAINFELRVGGESSAASSAGSWGPRTVLTASAQDRASSTPGRRRPPSAVGRASTFLTHSRRVGLATSIPVRPFPLKGSLAATRVAAGLVQVQSAGQAMPLLIAAMYGFPGDRASTDRVVQQVLDEVRALRCLFVLIGDFNWQCGEGGLLETLFAGGQLRNLDDCFPGLLPFTSPNRVRRLWGGASAHRCHPSGS